MESGAVVLCRTTFETSERHSLTHATNSKPRSNFLLSLPDQISTSPSMAHSFAAVITFLQYPSVRIKGFFTSYVALWPKPLKGFPSCCHLQVDRLTDSYLSERPCDSAGLRLKVSPGRMVGSRGCMRTMKATPRTAWTRAPSRRSCLKRVPACDLDIKLIINWCQILFDGLCLKTVKLSPGLRKFTVAPGVHHGWSALQTCSVSNRPFQQSRRCPSWRQCLDLNLLHRFPPICAEVAAEKKNPAHLDILIEKHTRTRMCQMGIFRKHHKGHLELGGGAKSVWHIISSHTWYHQNKNETDFSRLFDTFIHFRYYVMVKRQ